MHKPHSTEKYISLFKDAKKLKQLVRLGSLHGAMLGSLHTGRSESKTKELTGEIYRFVKLDPNEPWFNVETSDVATDDDVGAIKIPEHLLPHLQRIEFVFKPEVHELWFVSQDRKDRMGPKFAAAFFQQLFDRLVISGRYPDIEVTPLPDKDSLEEMMSSSTLEKITIELKRPNADDAGGDEAKWLKRLERQKARKITTEIVAAKGEFITPDEETQALAKVAARNGNVSITGRDPAGLKVEESTREKPMAISEYVDSDNETSLDVLVRTALNQ